MKDVNDLLKKALLVAVGSVSMSLEKSKELIDELVAKGELTVKQGKELNQELTHKTKEKLKSKAQEALDLEPLSPDVLFSNIDKLSKEQLLELKTKLDELEAGE